MADGLEAGADAAWLRARLGGEEAADPERDHAIWGDDAGLGSSPTLVPAAVLVGIVTGPRPGVLLTKRTSTLRRHAGQVAFPGGRIDPDDGSPERAALREAQEEIGLDPAHPEVIGRMGEYVTGTGYRVTPVVALLRPGFVTVPSPAEVEAVFTLDMATLLDPGAPMRRSAEYLGKTRHYWVWPHPEHEIWGATAAILVRLAERLRG